MATLLGPPPLAPSITLYVVYPPVGGLAELPDVSRPTATPYAALAAGLAAAALALAAGGWYARRRFSRR
jgi:hypothetical protein